ncbi:hypothetical protein CAC42_2955 [Sphaceloma murrayae]|uniref:Uncharacterized protein n=1 Tax=Sphaceloma murrayae TaxID=2082308 RepID=A0A2K1R0G0_9PEZI|nr:hypothetical protein CAC42_2955 [Sphaceloma murrayae]
MPSAVGKAKSRSSRFSSPLARNGSSAVRRQDADWLEPNVKETKASYEDHGGAAFGVLEDMQPLGQKPNAKVKARVKPEPLRKTLGKSMGALHDHNVTPEGTPSVETPRSASVPQEEAANVPLPTLEEATDDDYTPSMAKKTAKARRVRGSSGISDLVKTASPSAPPTAPSVREPSATTPVPSTRMSDLSPEELDRINFEAVVESAEKRARALGDEAFGAALRQIFLESQTNEHYAHLLRAILLQTATSEDKVDFTTAVRRAKRTLRRALPPRPISEAESSVHTATPKSHSQRPAPAHPSIEADKQQPIKLRLGHRRNGSESSNVNGGRVVRSTRSRRHSPSPSLTPVAADVDAMDITEVTQLASAAPDVEHASSQRSNSSDLERVVSGLHTNGNALEADSEVTESLSIGSGLHLAPADSRFAALENSEVKKSLKRSPVDAGLEAAHTDVVETAKRRKLTEGLYRDPPRDKITESHIRESVEGTRSLRNRDLVNHRPTLKLTNGTSNLRHKRGREPSDSPLSDMSLSPPPVLDPPTDASTSHGKKKAKTKQS